LSCPKEKSIVRSQWQSVPLRADQIAYAAMDASVAIHVAAHMLGVAVGAKPRTQQPGRTAEPEPQAVERAIAARSTPYADATFQALLADGGARAAELPPRARERLRLEALAQAAREADPHYVAIRAARRARKEEKRAAAAERATASAAARARGAMAFELTAAVAVGFRGPPPTGSARGGPPKRSSKAASPVVVPRARRATAKVSPTAKQGQAAARAPAAKQAAAKAATTVRLAAAKASRKAKQGQAAAKAPAAKQAAAAKAAANSKPKVQPKAAKPKAPLEASEQRVAAPAAAKTPTAERASAKPKARRTRSR
jgi:hypothetical protein